MIAPWYLRDSQKAFFDLLTEKKKVVAKAHRRWGKGTTVLTYAATKAIHTPGYIIRYGGPTQKQAYEILDLLLDHIYEPAPREKPKYTDGFYVWPNGSRLFVFGCGDAKEADKARGTEADLIIADEFAFWQYRPDYILNSVLGPQLDTTNGEMVITSTPPDDLTHPYIMEVEKAAAGGYLFDWNIEESLKSKDVSKATHERIIERCGGVDTDSYRREYKCEMIADKTKLVIPEAQNEELWVGKIKARPEYYNSMAMWDFGFSDFCAGLWGYLDFKLARFIIIGEYCDRGRSTAQIITEAKKLEEKLKLKGKIRRLGDSSDPQQLMDMRHDHEYEISGIVKRSHQSNVGFRESVLNGLRLAIINQKFLLDKDACPNTYLQLKYGIWDQKRKDFMRSEGLGHLDNLMCLAYTIDNVDFQTNPYPLIGPEVRDPTHFINRTHFLDSLKKKLVSLTGVEYTD